jgi:SAM-dependent methyltransferase
MAAIKAMQAMQAMQEGEGAPATNPTDAAEATGAIPAGGSGARSPAEVYEEQFVPALFRPWGRVVAAAAGLAPGLRVLDVACGTGALTEAVCERVGTQGSVVGLDANTQMLEVARRKPLDVDWREGRAEALPFPDASFDAVVSQFGLMFFDDRVQALREMMRVLRPDSRMAVAVCDGLARSPGYAALADVLQRLFGSRIADAFRAPFALGNEALLQRLCAQANIEGADIRRHAGTVRFRSIAALVATERACAWTLGGLLDDDQFERLLVQARTALAPFAKSDGAVAFAMPALVMAARRPA